MKPKVKFTLNLRENLFEGAFKLVVLKAFAPDIDGADGDNNGETEKEILYLSRFSRYNKRGWDTAL